MPNIIEQQDLLKGLPDAKISMLLQSPVGDIPPFLVAAEAQRRQAIRQQFAGTEQKESVVDTLTKQMAKVPQNIQGGQMTTPPVPPTPQMQGVMALQQQQAMQQAAQQAMPQQGMRAGGPVQRYQSQGLVTPTVDSLAASIAGMSPEEYKKKIEAEKIARLSPGKAKYLLENPTLPLTEAQKAKQEFYAATEGPFSAFYSPESVYEAAKSLTETEKPKGPIPGGRELPAAESARDFEAQMRRLAPRDKTAGQENTSTENQTAAEAAALRDRLEKLYGQTGLSDWEKAQKWFAASQQFLEPDQTLMQSVVGAAAAFAGGAAEERAAEREALIAKEKALLEWDMSRYDAQQRAAAEAARDAELYKRELEKEGRFSVKDQARSLEGRIDGIRSQIAKLDPISDKDEISRLQTDLGNLEARLSYIYETRGDIDYSGLRTFTGDGLAKI